MGSHKNRLLGHDDVIFLLSHGVSSDVAIVVENEYDTLSINCRRFQGDLKRSNMIIAHHEGNN